MTDLQIERELEAFETREADRMALKEDPSKRGRRYAIATYRIAAARAERLKAIAAGKIRYEAQA
jgi:hypothetical protein